MSNDIPVLSLLVDLLEPGRTSPFAISIDEENKHLSISTRRYSKRKTMLLQNKYNIFPKGKKGKTNIKLIEIQEQ